MDSFQRVADLKIGSAQDRAHALELEVERVENRIYSSPGSKRLLAFVRRAAGDIKGALESERNVATSGILSASEFEVRISRIIQVLPLLHLLVGFVEGSDIHHAPGQLIQPFRRFVQSVVPSAELIVSSKPELNYSIREIAGPIRQSLADTPLMNSCDNLPEFLFVVNIPSIEFEQILIHGVISHELGHALYDKNRLADVLLPQVKIRQDLVKALAKVVATADQQNFPPMAEVWLRQQVTDQVTLRVTRWLMELSSDAIGIRLFGPALYLAAIHLLNSFKHLDHASASHPPTRLRVKLMTRMLKEIYAVDRWHKELQEFVASWDEVSGSPAAIRLPYDQIALETVDQDDVLQKISDASTAAIPREKQYSAERFAKDVESLPPLVVNLIPPGELGGLGSEVPVDFVSIINAGWYVYMCEFDDFRKRLNPAESADRLASSAKLQHIVLKALEISETRIAWEEARRDSQRR